MPSQQNEDDIRIRLRVELWNLAYHQDLSLDPVENRTVLEAHLDIRRPSQELSLLYREVAAPENYP